MTIIIIGIIIYVIINVGVLLPLILRRRELRKIMKEHGWPIPPS